MARRLAALALAAVLAACAPQAPPNLRPAPLPVASRLNVTITPGCNYGMFSDFTFIAPVSAWYTAIDTTGPQQAFQAVAGTKATVVRQSNAGPWQLYMLTSDTTWAPISGIVVNYPGVCV